MNKEISTMSKEEVLKSIQKTIDFFQVDVLEQGFFRTENIDFKTEEQQKIKHTLKELIIKLKSYKDADISLYDEILEKVKNIEPFSLRVEEYTSLQQLMNKSILSNNTDKNARKLAELMKSNHIFDFINRKKKDITESDLKFFGESAPYVQLLWKQIKQEELLGLLLYVNSGKATQDYEKMQELGLTFDNVKSKFLYDSFKNSFNNLKIKNGQVTFSDKDEHTKVSSAYYLDYGVILNEQTKELFFGFATSNFDTTEQKKQYFEIMSSLKQIVENTDSSIYGYTLKPIYITNSILNENELKYKQTDVNKPFLKTFEKPLSKEDKNTLNKSSFISILGNLSNTDYLKGLDILDIVEANPYVAGADTFQEYEAFQSMKKNKVNFGESLAANMLRNYIINTASDMVSVLEKVAIQEDDTQPMHHVHGILCQHLQNMLKASMYNFAGHLSSEDYLNDNFITKVESVISRYDKVFTDHFMGQEPTKNIGISQFLDTDVRVSMEKNLKRVEAFKERKEDSSIKSEIISLNNNLKEKELAKSLLSICTVLEEITPLLREIPELKEKDISSMKEALTQAHLKMIKTPALINFRDVLNSIDSFEAPEAQLWMKRIQRWEFKKENLTGSALVKKELMIELFSNLNNPSEIKNIVELYVDSCKNEKQDKKIKL